MQERVLGAIIIGGIACVGVVWALIDGIPPISSAKKQESVLEKALVEKVKSFDSSVTSLDVRRATYTTAEVNTPTRRDPDKMSKMAVISLEGYNNDDKEFECIIQANTSYILDLQNRIGGYSGTASDAMKLNLYENYSITTPKLLNEILNTKDTVIQGYFISDGLYTALTGDSGTKIASVGDPNITNGKKNNPYSVSDVLSLTETPKKSFYCYGLLTEFSKNDDGTYNMWLSDGTNDKALKCEKVSIGTGIDKLEEGKYVTFQTGLKIEDGTKIISEITVTNDDGTSEKITPTAVSISNAGTLKLGEQALTVNEAVEKVSKYAYGEISDEEYYVTGTVAEVTSEYVQEEKKTYYTIRLVTEGTDENHYFEVQRALIDSTVVDEKDILTGDVITVYGKLTTVMYYAAK